jgi:hypothetical protein
MPPVRDSLPGRRAVLVRRALSALPVVAAAVATLALAPVLVLPAPAVADGDPASDVLLIDNVFYPYAPAVSPALTAALNTTVARAHAAGFPIKVALIESPIDLGAIPQLFGKPEEYAKYLDVEISYNSIAKLLVVMPQGFGTFASGSPAALSGIHIETARRSTGLAAAAVVAIGQLAKLAGHPISVPSIPGQGGSGSGTSGAAGSSGGAGRGPGGSGPTAAILAAIAVVAAIGAGVVALRRRRTRPAEPEPAADSTPEPAPDSGP